MFHNDKSRCLLCEESLFLTFIYVGKKPRLTIQLQHLHSQLGVGQFNHSLRCWPQEKWGGCIAKGHLELMCCWWCWGWEGLVVARLKRFPFIAWLNPVTPKSQSGNSSFGLQHLICVHHKCENHPEDQRSGTKVVQGGGRLDGERQRR